MRSRRIVLLGGLLALCGAAVAFVGCGGGGGNDNNNQTTGTWNTSNWDASTWGP